MTTYLAKRKGMSFYRITENGKTIKDYSISDLRNILLKNFPDSRRYIRSIKDKSRLWYLCVKHDLI